MATTINLKDYTYQLPSERIAKEPTARRSDSKLLLYNEGDIGHTQFRNLADHIPENASLFFNDTKVIPARLHLKKDTGALIEVFMLEPISPTHEVAAAMLVKREATWKCMVGNLKKWKDDQLLTTHLEVAGENITLTARLEDRTSQTVSFKWNKDIEFVHVISALGKIPLPPYIQREVNATDSERYQTVYNHHQGAVAAPTAGLHFDQDVLKSLKNKGITLEYLTLHVSAGTFQPIKEENVLNHPMHAEQLVVSRSQLESILRSAFTIAVGTTSMRTLESLYWYGVKLLRGEKGFTIKQDAPYREEGVLPDRKTAIQAVIAYMEKHHLSQITGQTEIFIYPGYNFKVCEGLVTNYHLPGSTLILLVAAFIGEDWRKVYQEALANNYRFLSYGDSSLLLPQKKQV